MGEPQTFEKTAHGITFSSDAYRDEAGAWRWVSNKAVVPLDAAVAYGIPVDPEIQRAAQRRDWDAFAAAYRERDTAPDAAQLYEMRAAFGPGTEVVNVITGRRTRL